MSGSTRGMRDWNLIRTGLSRGFINQRGILTSKVKRAAKKLLVIQTTQKKISDKRIKPRRQNDKKEQAVLSVGKEL